MVRVDPLPIQHLLNLFFQATKCLFRVHLCGHHYKFSAFSGQPNAEIINSVTGKDDHGNASRISKRQLFLRFLQLVGRIPSRTGITTENCSTIYGDAKLGVEDYQASNILLQIALYLSLNITLLCHFAFFSQQAKSQLMKAFQKSNLGSWLKKPIEQDQFELEIPHIS